MARLVQVINAEINWHKPKPERTEPLDVGVAFREEIAFVIVPLLCAFYIDLFNAVLPPYCLARLWTVRPTKSPCVYRNVIRGG